MKRYEELLIALLLKTLIGRRLKILKLLGLMKSL